MINGVLRANAPLTKMNLFTNFDKKSRSVNIIDFAEKNHHSDIQLRNDFILISNDATMFISVYLKNKPQFIFCSNDYKSKKYATRCPN